MQTQSKELEKIMGKDPYVEIAIHSVKGDGGQYKLYWTHLRHITKGLDEQICRLHLNLVNGNRTVR
jgi:hypothetical protein